MSHALLSGCSYTDLRGHWKPEYWKFGGSLGYLAFYALGICGGYAVVGERIW